MGDGMKIEEAVKVAATTIANYCADNNIGLDDLERGNDYTMMNLAALRALVETAEAGRWRPITETEPANWQNGARQLAER